MGGVPRQDELGAGGRGRLRAGELALHEAEIFYSSSMNLPLLLQASSPVISTGSVDFVQTELHRCFKLV